ncbi:hypothetical protein MBLNU459_g1131t1 [Dothideomycetes sp. NU459]
MRPAHLFTPFVVFTAVSATWPWQGSWQDSKAAQEIGALLRRADPSSNDATTATSATKASAAASSTAKTSAQSSDSEAASSTDASSAAESSAAASSGNSAAASSGASTTDASSSGAKSTGKSTGKSSATSGSGSQSTTSYTKSYGNSVGYGGASMVTPAATASSSYYKVGDYVTFAWNYTSIKISPTAVDIVATCTANQQTYTLAMNQTFNASGGEVVWDTGAYQSSATVPLLTEKYTLIIHDAAHDQTATAAYGGLAAYSQFVFGMYTPQSYTGLSEGWQCVTCSGAMTNMERQTLGVMLGVSALTIASFTWFAGGWGVF